MNRGITSDQVAKDFSKWYVLRNNESNTHLEVTFSTLKVFCEYRYLNVPEEMIEEAWHLWPKYLEPID